MKKLLCLLLALILVPITAFAVPSADELDALTDAEKYMLRLNVEIAIAGKKCGSEKPVYSYSLHTDLSTLTLQELQWMLDCLSGEEMDEPEEHDELVGSVLCSYKLFTITTTDAEIRTHAFSDDVDLVLYVDIVNDNNFSYEGYVDTVCVNEWQLDKLFWFNVAGGKKQKDKIVIKLKDIGVSSLEDIETLSIAFKLLYAKYAIVTDEVVLKMK